MRQARRGFTLIEMLVVVMVAAILMALIFPIASAAIASARRSSCMSNLTLISTMIEEYRQDYLVYPDMPNYVGLFGIPRGGVTGLALASTSIPRSNFWCHEDTFPDGFSKSENPYPERDLTYSTYQFGYNYWGLVTTTDGTPFPVTTREAFAYFMGDPTKIATGMTDPEWDLGLVKSFSAVDDARPVGLFQGLCNYRAPQETIVSFCQNHPVENPKYIPVVTTSGVANLVKRVKPLDGTGGNTMLSQPFPRKPDPINTPRMEPPIDWRVNKKAYTAKKSGSDYIIVEDTKNFGDTPNTNSAENMPVVEVYYRKFTADYLNQQLEDGFGWYNTGLELLPDDFIMVVANARWNYYALSDVRNRDFWKSLSPGGHEYDVLFNEAGELWFTAEGNPVEAQYQSYPATLLLPEYPHCVLVGRVGDVDLTDPDTGANSRANRLFSLGSRGSHLVTSADVPDPNTPQPLLLSLNDTQGVADYSDNTGWCELWIALYRPGQSE